MRPPTQKSLGKLCDRAPNLLVCYGWKVSYNGKFSSDQPNGPNEGALNLAHGSLLYISSLRRIGLTMRYLSLMVLPPFFSCVSLLPTIFPIPSLNLPIPIYRLPLLCMSWWKMQPFMLVGPLWDIFLIKWVPPSRTNLIMLKFIPTPLRHCSAKQCPFPIQNQSPGRPNA